MGMDGSEVVDGLMDGWVDLNRGPVVPHTHTFLAWSLSSIWPRSLPLAWAILFPDTRFPTITEAGPISAGAPESTSLSQTKQTEYSTHTAFLTALILSDIRGDLAADRPGCFCRGLGRLVTQVWGHIRTLQGCREPSKNSCLVSDKWIPPRGVLGRVLAGTRAKQNTPTLWMLSIACRTKSIGLSGEVKNRLQSICKEPRRSFQSRSDAGGDLYWCLMGNRITKQRFRKRWGENTVFARLMTCNKGQERNILGVWQ